MARINSKARPSYAISYGLAGGPAYSKQFSQLLQAQGFTQGKMTSADIIIAHSGGTWLIPSSAHPKLIIYVGMPLAQSKPRQTWQSARVAMSQHGKPLNGPKTRLKNIYYLVKQPRRNLTMLLSAKTAKPVTFSGAETVFISNQHDPWTRDKQLQSLIEKSSWAFLSLPGSHDDIWEHPERYTEIMEYYARLLA